MKFTDESGREYESRVTVATAIALKNRLEINLAEIAGGDLLERLEADTELLVNVLWLTVEKSAVALGVSQDEFADSLRGDVFRAAVDAMLGAIADFFPGPKRALLNELLAKSRRVDELATERAAAAVNRLTPEAILTSLSSVSSRPASSASSEPTSNG